MGRTIPVQYIEGIKGIVNEPLSPLPRTSESNTSHPSEHKSRFRRFKDYIGVTKLGITGANLFTTFVGLWLASHGHPQVRTLVMTLLGSTFIIGGACALNNFIDRDIDKRMTRTSQRVLVQGRVEALKVLGMGLALGLSGVFVLGTSTTTLAGIWGCVGFVTYVGIYTLWLKRTSPLSTVVGGIAGAAPPIIGWTAITGNMNVTAWLLFAFMFLWQPPHFYALAMKRVDEYTAAGIPLVPVVRGFKVTKQKILQWTLLMVPVTFLFFVCKTVGWFYMAVAVPLGLLYIVYAIKGLYSKDDLAWAKIMFKYSLIYMNVLFFVMIFDFN